MRMGRFSILAIAVIISMWITNLHATESNSNFKHKNSINLLIVSLFVTPSHNVLFNNICKALLAKGHTCTLITMAQIGKPIPGMTNIILDDFNAKFTKLM